jgi:hypothetical protein
VADPLICIKDSSAAELFTSTRGELAVHTKRRRAMHCLRQACIEWIRWMVRGLDQRSLHASVQNRTFLGRLG